jgi:hypothetical protein
MRLMHALLLKYPGAVSPSMRLLPGATTGSAEAAEPQPFIDSDTLRPWAGVCQAPNPVLASAAAQPCPLWCPMFGESLVMPCLKVCVRLTVPCGAASSVQTIG